MADLQGISDYLVWSDERIAALLDRLTGEEFAHDLGELTGSLHSKTAHIVSIYDSSPSILDGEPCDEFPDRSHLSRAELLKRGREILSMRPGSVSGREAGLGALPLAGKWSGEHASARPGASRPYRRASRLGVHNLPRAVDPPEEVCSMTPVVDVTPFGGSQLNVRVDHCPREVPFEVRLDVREAQA